MVWPHEIGRLIIQAVCQRCDRSTMHCLHKTKTEQTATLHICACTAISFHFHFYSGFHITWFCLNRSTKQHFIYILRLWDIVKYWMCLWYFIGSLMCPDRFFPFSFVVVETTKKQSGNSILVTWHDNKILYYLVDDFVWLRTPWFYLYENQRYTSTL